MENNKKLGLLLLVAFGVGSTIGGGIFNIPTDFAGVANPPAVVIAWLLAGVGVLALALVFQLLSNRRPELKGGIYTYAKAGFGDFMGFNSAWGYWLSGFLGNVAFFVLLFKTVNSLLGEENGIPPVMTFILASMLLWLYHYLHTKGIKTAGTVNAIVTIAKLIPLALVIIFGIFAFNPHIFAVPEWQTKLASTGEATTVMNQIKGAMGTILWAFIGIEASVVLSEKAESPRIVGKATVLTFVILVLIYISVSVVSMGTVPAKELVNAQTPLANVLSRTPIGSVGAYVVKLGLIISLLGALIGWIIYPAEVLYVAAKDGVLPKWFAKETEKGVPINSLIVTNLFTQIFLVSLFSEKLQKAYYSVYLLATACILVPYLFSALYAIKVVREDKLKTSDLVIALLATIYSLYVIYAIGLVYLAAALIMYMVGIGVYYFAKKEKGLSLTTSEKIASFIIVVIAIYMIVQIALGKITL